MKKVLFFLLMATCVSCLGCGKSSNIAPIATPIPASKSRPASLGFIGDSTDVTKTVTGGMVLMGGGTDVDAAFRWMIDRSGGGNVVVIRATGTEAYNSYIYGLDKVSSVETLKIDSRELANNDTVATIIRNAEMVFIAGGDQSNYTKYWKGTKTETALNYLLTQKKAPLGGTSAGCAILGGLYYSGENGSVTSSEALQNPYINTVTLYNNDFLKAPYLQNIITDQHYLTRSREGRSTIFLGRINKDWKLAAKAIAVDERTAVCIDADGSAKVYADYSATRPYSYAYFIVSDLSKAPEQFEANKIVTWNAGNKALAVYEIPASVNGGGSFNVGSFSLATATGGKAYWWWIENGILNKKEQ